MTRINQGRLYLWMAMLCLSVAACMPEPAAPEITPPPENPVAILSTQATPVEEATRMRRVVLGDFPGVVEFNPVSESDLLSRLNTEASLDVGSVDVVVTLHGNYPNPVADNRLQDLSALATDLEDYGIPANFMELGRLDTDQQYYIPLMQATYIMFINREALAYLPDGIDITQLTWDDLLNWSRNINEATGENKLGFPMNELGLWHRILQGYLYPSFTGGMVTPFRNDNAVAMWEFLRELWPYIHENSLTYAFMDEPLQSGEVWLAIDHVARGKAALEANPEGLVAVPAPAGPVGRGFMPVLVGMSVPVNAPNPDGASEMIQYLLEDDIQIRILREIGFFPVVSVDLAGAVSEGTRLEAEAVAAQANAPDAITALLPVGLGDLGGDFNQVYRDAFIRIVVNGEAIEPVLSDTGDQLQAILDMTQAPCWPPDPPSQGPCQVE